MGYLRTYLALCVVAAHSSQIFPWATHDGRQAVEIFFICSGFYMSLILSGRYKTKRAFYASRGLRIFTPYYAVLLVVIMWSLLSGLSSGNYLSLSGYQQRAGTLGTVIAALSNVTIFGQDWIMFLKHDLGQRFGPTTNFYANASPLYRYLIIPQAWSIGIEETFYLLAPFIYKLRTRLLCAILLLSLAGRLYAYHAGYLRDPWTYRFFPFELGLFVLGILAYRVHAKLRIPKCKHYWVWPGLLMIGFWLAARIVASGRIEFEYAVLLSYPFWAIAIIFLFGYFGDNKIDRFIGELCYPIYLIHMIVALTFKQWISGRHLGLAVAVLTVALSILFYVLFLRRLEKWRHRFVSRLDQVPLKITATSGDILPTRSIESVPL
jgi:peptidoglycan/LPS O-acetylase OafA/YrhL